MPTDMPTGTTTGMPTGIPTMMPTSAPAEIEAEPEDIDNRPDDEEDGDVINFDATQPLGEEEFPTLTIVSPIATPSSTPTLGPNASEIVEEVDSVEPDIYTGSTLIERPLLSVCVGDW